MAIVAESGPACGPRALTPGAAAEAARRGGKALLAQALCDARARTLKLADAWTAALGPSLRVPQQPELNLPLWEWGHVGWFADWWLARNPQRHLGLAANPDGPRLPARQAARGVDADALYHSSHVAHAQRWQLQLPTAEATRADLAASLSDTLALLAQATETDAGLYFFRLALFHEDMHAEAATYMAQTLGLDLGLGDSLYQRAAGAASTAAATTPATLHLPATDWVLGWTGPGFAFDNELGTHTVQVPDFHIDARPLTWAQYLPSLGPQVGLSEAAPRYLRRSSASSSGWDQLRFGQWRALNLADVACHLSAHEAQAWCRWAGRRLPTEAEWEVAAHTLPGSHATPGFVWGQVWEWTASAFAPFPGFVAHPYQDYSQPWFDGRPVLKGASAATVPRMRHPRYRNFYTPERNDLFAGFRSVAC